MTRNVHFWKKKKNLPPDERTLLKLCFKISELSYNHSISLSCCFCCFFSDEWINGIMSVFFSDSFFFLFKNWRMESMFRSCVVGSTIINVFLFCSFFLWDTIEDIFKEMELSFYWLQTFFPSAPFPLFEIKLFVLLPLCPTFCTSRDYVLFKIPPYFDPTNKVVPAKGFPSVMVLHQQKSVKIRGE